MGRGPRLALAAIAAALVLAPATRAELSAESMYRPGTVVSIRLNLPEKSQSELEAAPKSYVRGTFSLAETGGSPSSIGPYTNAIEVGIKLKGSASLQNLNGKSAFKVKFGKYVKGQTFLGLQNLTLNNMVQDASMLHETLSYGIFRANRVPASQTGFANVQVVLKGKEENFGMHLNLETYDQVALEKRFGPFAPPQHLYEGEYASDVTAAEKPNLKVDEGEEGDRSDLDRLVAAIEGSSPADFSDRVGPDAELQEMVHQWAVEKYVGHWDGYAGQEGAYQPNNYYLYSSAAGVFEMLPSGTDQTWGVKLGFADPAGVLFNKCLADASCATMYRRALRELLASVPALEIDSLTTRTATLLAPWQALETSSRRTGDAAAIQNAVEATRSFAAGRPAELTTFLASQPAEPKAAHVVVSIEPGTIPATGGSGRIEMRVTGAGSEPIFGDQLSLSAAGAGITFGPVVDEGDGHYGASFSAAPGTGKVAITAADATAGISGSATVAFEEVPPSPSVTPSVPSSPSGGGSKAASTATDPKTAVTAPLVAFARVPGHRTTGRRPVFSFGSSDPASTFVCRVGKAPFKPCHSPMRLPRLSPGRHVFSVAAVSPEGTRGEPRSYRFLVSIRRRTRVPE